MPSLSLKIIQDDGAVTRKVKFDSRMTIKEAHKVVKEKVIVPEPKKEYALFLRSTDDNLTGIWLQDDKTLEYYMLKDGDSLDYICRVRNLRIRLLDDTVKTLQVDEAKSVGELMIEVCARIGITNYDEYGLCHDETEVSEGKESKEPATGTLTLKRKQQQPSEEDAALKQLIIKLKTDDNVDWLDQHRTLREQGIDSKETLLLKRRLFYSDRNVDSRDPVQLHLLYVQTRDAILVGRHPVTEQQAADFAGIQCQINFGDFQEKKHKPGFIENLQEFLPEQYSNAWGVEKKILKAYAQHQGLSELEAKFLYIKTARALPTYGVTFFLVKEKQKDKKKLVPRLLGINSEAILRLDEVTKEILQQWPLTHVKTYHAGKSQTFTLNFGDYSDKEYSVKTQDCLRIRDILEGYIDIIRRRMLAKPHAHPGDSMAIYQDNVQAGKSHLIEHISNSPSKMVTETFVGPNRLLPYEQGSKGQSGATLTTVQQIVVTDHLQNQQQALKGEIPVRGDMSQECVRKLNRLNSNSVKIVGLLTDPTDVNIKDAQKIVENMQEDLPVVEKGVKETAEKQTLDGAKKMLLDELQDLNNYMNKLAAATRPGHVNTNDAKDAAENIADLTTQMYFSIDPKTRRRSELLRRSRKSFRAGDKQEQTMRRASFVAAATSALHSVDTAKQTFNGEYTGQKLDDAQRKKLEKSLEDRMGKLNAAIALYLTAHSDPESVDYSAAINSMNTIHELMPELAKDAQILASTKDAAGRKELQDDMRALFDATRKVCGMTGTEGHEKMQAATHHYADVAGKLIFTFARGTNAEKENQIIDLAKDAGARTSELLMAANELTCQAAAEPAAADVDAAGVRTAGAARDLLACAQLTAPAIHEPHCQSALTAACEALASSVHNMEATWRPLLEDTTRQPMSDQLHGSANAVMKALDKLKDAYTTIGDVNDDASLPLQERQRLKFINTMSGAKANLKGVDQLWEQSAAGSPSEQQKAEAQHRLEQKMAQLNAAVAALAVATADRENPDYATAELAISTISELMPQIVKDTEVISCDKDAATRAAMLQNVRALCDAARDMCQGDGYQQGQGEAASNFAAASGKLLFLVSPGADKGKEKHVMEVASAACDKSLELLSQAQRLRELLEPGAAEAVGSRAAGAGDATQALRSVAQVTAPSIGSARCQDALSSAAMRLRSAAADLTSCGQQQVQQLQQRPDLQHISAAMLKTQKQLDDHLRKLDDICQQGQNHVASSGQQEKQRLKFINSVSAAKSRLDHAEQQLKDVKACQMMKEEDAAALQHQLSNRLAQLNAAVAALAAATADRENPDYAAAEKAMSTISELVPHIVQDSRVLCGTKNEADRDDVMQDVRALCEACRQICDGAEHPQDVGEAAAKFAAASGKLVFLVSPRSNNDKENEVLDLSSSACGKASELLAQVQSLTEQIEPEAAAELDSRGARAADAAQALLTVAQATGSTISDVHCQEALVSAAEKLRASAAELMKCSSPHLQQRPDLQHQLLATQQQLDDRLDKLIHACRTGHGDDSRAASSGQQEKQRLKFINSVSAAKSRLDHAEQQLKKPMVTQMKPEDAAVLQHQLSGRLAQLNAAVAALAAATADRENPDYVAADKAIKTITELMPQIAQDSHALSSTKKGGDQTAMLQDIRALCDATREICDGVGQPQGLNDAAAKFSAASKKLVFLVSPKVHDGQEKEVVRLSADACGKTTELLAQVQALTEEIQKSEPKAAAELDSRGAQAADAAQALLTVAQLTASSISEPSCSSQLVSSAEKLRASAAELMKCSSPHLQQRPDLQHQLLATQHQLDDSINRLVNACNAAQQGTEVTLSPQQEKQRLQFVGSMSGAKKRLEAPEQQMKEPVLCQLLRQQDAAALQHQLSARLAQLNAAVAALGAATSDGKNPDYVAAERAVTTITELMPQIVQDSRTLCGTKEEGGQAAMLEQLRALCDASRAICDSAGRPKTLHENSAKLGVASGKLMFLISPENKQQIRDGKALGPKPVPGKRPAVPARDSKHKLAHAAPAGDRFSQTQDFIDALRSEEDRGNSVKIVGINAKTPPSSPNEEKQALEQFSKLIDTVEEQMTSAEDGLKVLHDAKSISSVGEGVSALEVTRREQHMEDCLARAAVQVAALVAANYADKLDYKAAMEPTMALTESVKSIVEDGGIISGSLHEESRKPFIDDMSGLCHATRDICKAARSDKEKLNDAAISFGNQSAKLLRVVSSEVNPTLEKEVISRAKAIGDTASRLALEASNVASSAGSTTAGGDSPVQDICTAGTRCVDAAGKLVYTAKLVAPTIHHATCQDALISSADSLSSSLATFSDTWKPLSSTHQPNVQKLTEEARRLEELLEKLRKDIRVGKLGKKKEVDQFVNLDMPLKQMTVQIMDTAKYMSEHGQLQPELKQEYSSYSNRLADAIRNLDLANARYQRALHDKNKRNEMEIAIQDLQMTVLQTRPSRAGQETNNIVDFRDFLQDLAKEADQLQQAAKKNEGAAGKKVTDDIKLLCTTISEDATKLLNPADNRGDGVNVMTSVDDIMDIAHFGQECDVLVKEINAAIQGIHDQKAKQALRAKALPLNESCHLLRFATNCHISATKSAEFDEALRDLENFRTSIMQPLVSDVMQKNKTEKKAYTALCGAAPPTPHSSSRVRASAALLRASTAAPAHLCPALTHYSTAHLATRELGEDDDKALIHLNALVNTVQDVTSSGCMELSNFEYDFQVTEMRKLALLKELTELDHKIASRNIKNPVLNAEDIDKLLLCDTQKIEGSPKQLEDKVQQLSSQLSSMSNTIVQSVSVPTSLSRGLRAAAGAAAQLAATARALKQYKKPVQGRKIEDAAHEMCLATYSLMKTSELVCQDPKHHDSKRKMLEASQHLNDSINKLVRSISVRDRLSAECAAASRGLQLRRGAAAVRSGSGSGDMPYDHCLDTLHSQRDVLQKLNSDQAMSREEFLQSLCYVTSAAGNSADCAAHAAYLLSVSEKDKSIGKEGIVDVSKLHKSVEDVENSCVAIIMGQQEEQIQEDRNVLQTHVQDLLDNLKDAAQKTKSAHLKEMLVACKKDVTASSQALYKGIDQKRSKPEIISLATSLMEDANNVANLTEHPDLVPTVADVSADTQAKVDEVMKSSLSLLTNTEELIKQVKSAPEEPEVMKWVMFNKRKDVLDAFEALLKTIKSNGVKAGLVEGSMEESEQEKKSYVQKQFDTASKWLLKPMSKADVKTNGQQAVRNLIEVANKITEDLKGSEKEDMRHLVEETQQLLSECSKKYDHEQYSVLIERVRELKKGIERGVVTRVVEDFMDAEAPLADLDILADHEKDESKRKFLLERKIAELLAHLGRVTKTARLIAHTDTDSDNVATQLNTCTEQAELLAPMLVKAAQQRVASPDDKVVIENYKSLLAKYVESMSKIRDLCDQSVDPMDFVQTAGETMQRMREESSQHNDPLKCAHTSAAITKLANRVIHVGMSSASARSDPELAAALSTAQKQLSAAASPAGTRASRQPDWRDTTAKILQATEEVESMLGGETIFKKQPEPNQPIYNEALNLHFAIRDWSSRDNEIVAVAKRMAVLMAKLSNFMNNDKQHEVLATSKSIVTEAHEVARLAKKLAHECSDHRIKTNLLQTCERIPTISGQLKMLTTVKGFSLGRHGTQEDKEALDMLVGNAQSLMLSIQDVVKGAASASVKIMSQRGPRMKWVRKTHY